MHSKTILLICEPCIEDAREAAESELNGTEYEWEIENIVPLRKLYKEICQYRDSKKARNIEHAKTIIKVATDFISGETDDILLWGECKDFYKEGSFMLSPQKHYYNTDYELRNEGIPNDPKGWYAVIVDWHV